MIFSLEPLCGRALLVAKSTAMQTLNFAPESGAKATCVCVYVCYRNTTEFGICVLGRLLCQKQPVDQRVGLVGAHKENVKCFQHQLMASK